MTTLELFMAELLCEDTCPKCLNFIGVDRYCDKCGYDVEPLMLLMEGQLEIEESELINDLEEML